MVEFPLDPTLAKILLMGEQLKCVGEEKVFSGYVQAASPTEASASLLLLKMLSLCLKTSATKALYPGRNFT
jgi:HrpA-like RNA helicase